MAMETLEGDGTWVSEPEAMAAAASLFHALSDPSRLAILRHLALGEHRVVDLTSHLGLAQSTVSKHLACLRGCGLVDFRAHGRSSLYFLTEPERVAALLATAEALLAATGDATYACVGPAPSGPAPSGPTPTGRAPTGRAPRRHQGGRTRTGQRRPS